MFPVACLGEPLGDMPFLFVSEDIRKNIFKIFSEVYRLFLLHPLLKLLTTLFLESAARQDDTLSKEDTEIYLITF